MGPGGEGGLWFTGVGTGPLALPQLPRAPLWRPTRTCVLSQLCPGPHGWVRCREPPIFLKRLIFSIQFLLCLEGPVHPLACLIWVCPARRSGPWRWATGGRMWRPCLGWKAGRRCLMPPSLRPLSRGTERPPPVFPGPPESKG